MSEHEVTAVSELTVAKVALADVVANQRRGGDIRVLLSPRTVGASAGFFGVLTLAAHEYVSEHFHPYSEEFLYTMTGRVSVRLDGERHIELSAGEGLVVAKGVRHRVTNAGDGTATVAFCLAPLAPRPELGHVDTEVLPDAAAPLPDVESAR